MKYPELTLKQKTTFLNWAIKKMTNYTILCVMFDDWYNVNVNSPTDLFYSMVSFPELIKTIIQRGKRQGYKIELDHKRKLFSMGSLTSGKLSSDQYRINLLKQVKKYLKENND